MSWRIGIDVGGTFTDLVAVDEAGQITHAKSASTPADQSEGVIAGLNLLAQALGLSLSQLLAGTGRIVHGTTVATNALLERKGAKVGLLTTAGHRDVLEMREGLKDGRYDLHQPAPEPLVPRDRRLGVVERIRSDGRIEQPLDEGSLQAAIAELKRQGVDAVAICYLHSWRDPTHERRTAEAVRSALPGVHLSLSCDIHPQIKEFERVATTCINAYVGPALARYLGRLEERLRAAGYTGPVLIVQSHGGLATIGDAVRVAAGAVLSGPAGGVAAAQHVAKHIDLPDLIPFDMGGTSTDISLVQAGQAAIAGDRRLAGQRIALQSLDIASIGAGGGSIARVDAGGILRVGPESAGAVPGPACYGRGGTLATVTDANLVLGLLDPDRFMGGAVKLDRDAAQRAVDGIAVRLGVDRLAAATGIHRVINTAMAEGVRLVSVRRGVDPRRFALLSFGGAAGLHVTDIARQLEIGRVLVPRLAAVLSAFGMLTSDLRYEQVRTHIAETGGLAADGLRAIYAQLEEQGRQRLAQAAFAGPVAVSRSAEMRYGEQIFEIAVDLDGIDWDAPDLPALIARAFHDRHEQLYTYALPDQEPVLVNARLAVRGLLPVLPREPRRPAGAPVSAAARRPIHLGASREVDLFDLEELAPGQDIAGPAIVESSTTTVLLRERDQATVTPQGWLDIAIGRGG